ncbi:MAG: hypothetical protein AAGA20_19195, partial [Planctomycetota bacterium]
SGRFELEVTKLRPGDDLVAVASGAGAALLRDHGRGLLEGTASDRADLVLDGATGVVRGRIVGAGAARAGWQVALDDPTLLEFSFSSVEKRAAGREGPASVAADGTFTIGGLFDRTYALRVWRPDTGAVVLTRGVRPGDAIEIDPARDLRSLRGSVKDGAGATVTVVHRTFVNADGGGGLYDSGPGAACDDEGRFALEVVPREGAALDVRLASGTRFLVPVELIGDAPDVELEAPATAILDVRCPHLDDAHTLHVEDAAGRILPIRPLVAGGSGATREVVESEGGRFRTTLVPPSAAAAVVVRPDGAHIVLPFEPAAGSIVHVRLR